MGCTKWVLVGAVSSMRNIIESLLVHRFGDITASHCCMTARLMQI